MKKYFLFLFSLVLVNKLSAQNSKNVLFIGNSYTNSNNMTSLLNNIASSRGYVLNISQSTPGGHTFQNHTTNAASLNLINQGNWDYVVLQEQSQLPSFPISQVQSSVYPFATQLKNLIVAADSCAQTVFFMTWGRQNGDAGNCAVWPPVCTYQGMDSLLSLRYQFMAAQNQAVVSPVGAVWKYIRSQHPNLNLYSSDGSHPSLSGSYAAALTFYTIIYRSNPTFPNYLPALPSNEISQIKNAVKSVVYDSLSKWNVGLYDPHARYTYSSQGAQVQFTPTSISQGSFRWDFGDGNTSTQSQPVHQYAQSGNYNVKLLHQFCGKMDSTVQNINAIVNKLDEFVEEKIKLEIYPNPSRGLISINAEQKDLKRFEIFDISGRLVLTGQLNSENQITASKLRPGVYRLRLLGKRTSAQASFVIEP